MARREFPLVVDGIPTTWLQFTQMATKRVRGQLLDITNSLYSATPTRSKRACAGMADVRLKQHSFRHASKGLPRAVSSSPASESPSPSPSPNPSTNPQDRTLKQLLKDRPDVINNALNTMKLYVERHTTLELQKACALNVVAGAVLSGHGILEACDLAAKCTAFAARTIRRWASDVFVDFFSIISNIDDVTDKKLEMELHSGRGRHPKWISLMCDEGFRKEVRKYVAEKGYVKGSPNLTLQQLVLWVKESHGADVSTSTMSLWLHDMGFSYKQFSKGVYFDGHEREDVVEARKVYLAELASYGPKMWTSHSPAPNPLCHPVIRVFHDESTFYANADQSFHWTDGSKQALKQKSLGQAIMVSDHF